MRVSISRNNINSESNSYCQALLIIFVNYWNIYRIIRTIPKPLIWVIFNNVLILTMRISRIYYILREMNIGFYFLISLGTKTK